MISNQILQSTIDGIKAISGVDMLIYDVSGRRLACSVQMGLQSSGVLLEEEVFGPFQELEEKIRTFGSSLADSQESGGLQFFKINDEAQIEYILVAKGAAEQAYMVGRMAAFQIQNLLVAYKERFDRDNFIKNLILDNLLLVDIYNRAQKLRIEAVARRVVIVLEVSEEADFIALEKVREHFDNSAIDFVTAVDEKNVIVIKELLTEDEPAEIEDTCQSVIERFRNQKVLVSYGTVVNEIKEVSKSYKEARMALDVGKIFFSDREIIAYSALGIGRLIYQLPIPLCRMFIKEIFENTSPDDFDEETITTVNKFFENNLNVSETSRQLFIHRNTLVYRLDKLQKEANLDLRNFEDAITFKIALMVVRYMKYMEDYEF